jgi:hypothetical protein
LSVRQLTILPRSELPLDSDGRDILYFTGVVRMQVELPDVREAIIAHDSLDQPAIIVMDGNGIGRDLFACLRWHTLRERCAGGAL